MRTKEDKVEKQAMRLTVCVLISATFVFGTVAPAAEPAGFLRHLQGRVLVNAGEGYEAGQAGMSLKLGDRVLTLTGATAVVVQDDGCVTRLAGNMAFALQKPSVCKGGVNSLREVGPYFAQAIGAEEQPDVPPEEVEEVIEAPPAAVEPPPAAVEAPEEQPEVVVAEEEEPPPPDKKKKRRAWLWAAIGAALVVAGGGGGGSSGGGIPPPSH
ncbi:MAG: hypothetical protein ACE5FE_01125 [Acidiferrobacterales bacterium]